MDNSVVITIQKEDDIVIARKMGRELSDSLELKSVNKTRVITAVSELARNIYKYAEFGEIRFETITGHQRRGIKVTAYDKGPGITDIDKALQIGYTTSNGLGAGLPGVKNLMDEFKIKSAPDQGTTVIVVKWQLSR